MSDYLKLHFVILLWGSTAILGNLIELSATQLVFYRSSLAAALLFVFLRRHAKLPVATAALLLLNGAVLGTHWIFFFLAVKVANVSICMIAMATISFWTALLEPLLVKSCRFQWVNLILGMVVMTGIYSIYRHESQFHYGLAVGLIGAILATLFSIANGQLASRASEQSIVMYEMAGAAIVCAATLLVSEAFGLGLASDRWMLTPREGLFLGMLVLGGTLLAYHIYVSLLHRLSVFTINFANNLEPIYGITLGALFFGDHQYLGPDFYIGAVMILSAVVAQPVLAIRARRKLQPLT
ncbi:DMT family transporter [Rhodopirellula sp. MGV]|uniref:DMT family transporter n=1 Tax=Rhodopirellula sp. MGV TaxID=2023130 RepID=UPI000B9721EB|nr:EamA family transporter [Rhodopirellula sp. MGV]OYP36378.1 permease [Rhodopirellula sp. MGV]PNY38389.1 permease [Rhodopirellula baltica]